MEKYICIHGHFYQPPRENAWLEYVELQDSAYPFHDWNERITAECYAPNGTSRILDGESQFVKIMNNYAHISFNFGPTLLAWLAENEPDATVRILRPTRRASSIFRPRLRNCAGVQSHDSSAFRPPRQIHASLWGIRDFEYRFGR